MVARGRGHLRASEAASFDRTDHGAMAALLARAVAGSMRGPAWFVTFLTLDRFPSLTLRIPRANADHYQDASKDAPCSNG